MRGSHTRLAVMRPIRAVAVFAAVVIVLALPVSALAARPVERFHDHFTETFESNLCGIDGTSTIVVQNTFTLYSDGSFKSAGSFSETFTALNGKSVKISSAGTTSGPEPVIDEEAGTITFITSSKGLPEKIQTNHGSVLLRDAGVITFADTFDLETGEFLGSEVTIKGPHPEAESDFEAFCEVVVSALT
jgi:hypothetical protein